jgi:two-component system response regulator (stage 0 sporulation protein A)
MPEWKILIVEDNRQFADAVSHFFRMKKTFMICGVAQNAIEAISLLSSATPDLILLDLVMPQSDGFVLLEYLHNRPEPKPDVIVLTSLNHESVIQKASDLGTAYYMVKPVSLEDLYARCIDIIGFRAASCVRDADSTSNMSHSQQIETLIFNMGIPSHNRGYEFLVEAICLVVENPDLIYHITRQLYPIIAEKFNTTANSVERAIRHVIESAWKNDTLQNANRLIRFVAFTPQHKPTNGEFISIVVKKCILLG